MSEEDKKPHLCTMCHMAFLEIEELRKHVIFEHSHESGEKELELSVEFSDVNDYVSKGEQNGDAVFKSEDVSLENGALNEVIESVSENQNHSKIKTDEETLNLTSYDRVYFHDQSLLDDLPQHVQNALLQCKVCRIIFNSSKALEEHMSTTHGDSQELIQHIKEEKDAPVVTGSCYINMFAACKQESAPPAADLSDTELSCKGEEDDEDEEEEEEEDDQETEDVDDEDYVPEKSVVKSERKVAHVKNGEGKIAHVKSEGKVAHVKSEEKVVHSNTEKVNECKVCKLVFESQQELTDHMPTHEAKKGDTRGNKKLLKCKKCDKSFRTNYKLTKHKIAEHKADKEMHKCTKCDKSFATNARFKKHLVAHEKNDGTNKKPFQCSVCDKEFATGNHLKQHMMIHTGFRPYQCSQCGKGFIKRADLLRHETTHSDVKPYLCSLCAKGFGTSCQLKFHMMRHTGETPFTCTTCGKGFIAKKYLRIHERLHSGKKPFLCNLCGRGLSSRKRLKAHIMLHTGEKAFPCAQCDKSYTSKHHLEKHMIVHVEGPYICTICNRECRGKGNLERHMKSCSGETRHLLEKYKDVECPICNKKFKKYNLKQHVRIHTGEKPFVCPKCNKAYKRNYLLEEHMRTHSGEKPFVCSICEKAFARKLNMKVHMRTHTGEKVMPRARNHESIIQDVGHDEKQTEMPYDYRQSSIAAEREKIEYSRSSAPSSPNHTP